MYIHSQLDTPTHYYFKTDLRLCLTSFDFIETEVSLKLI